VAPLIRDEEGKRAKGVGTSLLERKPGGDEGCGWRRRIERRAKRICSSGYIGDGPDFFS
jgi:hypothetical protein